MPADFIDIRGARVHNLKDVSIKLPKNKLIVFTGISGSGKSSLAFDTIYAEGQRRYVESLSSYAKQFIGLMDKPDVDQIEGLSPAIAIDQRSVSTNPRSTVGTLTEIYDYMRLMYSRVGKVHCPHCDRQINQQTPAGIFDAIIKLADKKSVRIQIFSPITDTQNNSFLKTLQELENAGYHNVRVNGKLYIMADAKGLSIKTLDNTALEVLHSQTEIPSAEKRKSWPKENLLRSIDSALDLGNGHFIVVRQDTKEEIHFSQYFYCLNCRVSLPTLEPRNFSFNSPAGACQRCLGLGTRLEVDTDLVMPNKKLTIEQGAIKPWVRNFFNQNWYWELLELVGKKHGFALNIAVQDLSKKALDVLLHGSGDELYSLESGEKKEFAGVISILEEKYSSTSSDYLRKEIGQYMRVSICPACEGKRLKKESLSVKIAGKNISEINSLNIEKAHEFFKTLQEKKKSLSVKEMKIAELILKEVVTRLSYLNNVGLSYITLERSASTLSGGEAQRVRLATQISMSLSGVVYILDEPSIGLHQKDNKKLINTLIDLRDLGNTVIVVEHDPLMMESADLIVDIGPGAGDQGGKIVAMGTPKEIQKDPNSITGKYLSGKEKIVAPKEYRKGNKKHLEVLGASEFNLKNIDVKIPLGNLVCFTGVSGSGKSTLLLDILVKSLAQKFYRAKDIPGKHKEIKGVENIDKVISIDQSPIGRTPRSNPATYTGVFTHIRDVFTQTPEAKIRGYDAGKFSFNARGGRCESCAGEGMVKIEMQFLPDVYVWCEDCRGKRYMQEILEIHYNGKNIADILDMTVSEAMKFFVRKKLIYDKLKTLDNVGLGYIKLGQSATTLSGGEAQRVKLATELSRRATGKTLYILDEPTTGLHSQDIKKLLHVLNQLVDKGNSVFIIEHNLDVIRYSDWVIDMGPGGGDKGGVIVAEGIPTDIMKEKKSFTGQFLKETV